MVFWWFEQHKAAFKISQLARARGEDTALTLELVLSHTPHFSRVRTQAYLDRDVSFRRTTTFRGDRPGTLYITNSGAEAWEIKHILDCRMRGCGFQYLVCWRIRA